MAVTTITRPEMVGDPPQGCSSGGGEMCLAVCAVGGIRDFPHGLDVGMKGSS